MVLMFALCSSRKLFFQITGLARQSKLHFSLHLSVSVFLFSHSPLSSVSLQRGVIQFSEYTSGRRSVKTHLSFHNTCEFSTKCYFLALSPGSLKFVCFLCLRPVIQIFWRLFFLDSERDSSKEKYKLSSVLKLAKRNLIYCWNNWSKLSHLSQKGLF